MNNWKKLRFTIKLCDCDSNFQTTFANLYEIFFFICSLWNIALHNFNNTNYFKSGFFVNISKRLFIHFELSCLAVNNMILMFCIRIRDVPFSLPDTEY